MFRYIRNRLSNTLMTRLDIALKPIQTDMALLKTIQTDMALLKTIQTDMALLKTNQELNQIQITQMLRAMGKHINPELIIQFLNIETGKTWQTEFVINPNYAKQLRPDDVFLVSYPRSGNTWMRTIIAYILYRPDILVTLKDLEVYVPDLHYDLPYHDHYSQPRVLKTHEPYFKRQGAGIEHLHGNFIYMIRHPYKTLTSYYDFEAYSNPDNFMPIGEFVEQVLHNAYFFGGWAEHVQSWRYATRHTQSIFIRYEDLLKAPVRYIQHIAQFLGKPLNEAQAEQVRMLSSQDNMRELENKDPHRVGYEIIRQGEERQTKQTLDDTMKNRIYMFCKTQMDDFGYLADGTTTSDYPAKELYSIP